MEKKRTYEELEKRILELEGQRRDGGNREYKSRLFCFIFGREENKQWTLSLYNAIHGSSYDDPSSITINTIEDVVYMGMKNDLSILVSDNISLYRSMELYEQQSTYNPNMPIREFMYAGKLYDKYIHSAGLNQYGRKLLPLPVPKLVTFYNGGDEQEDEVILSLSDAFKEEIRRSIMGRRNGNSGGFDDEEISAEVDRIFKEAEPDIAVNVRMVNINYGHNKGLLSACRPLDEYAWFVDRARKNLSAVTNGGKTGISGAIDKTIDEMPLGFEIRKFITANRAEVRDMCLTEYNEAETMEMLKEEGRLEGRLEGQHETLLLNIRNLMDGTGWDAEKAMDILKVPGNQRAALYAVLTKKI